jgi:hypothetical protein
MPRLSQEERLAQAKVKAREKLANDKRALAIIESAERAEQRKARDKRRYLLGAMVDEAGLAGLDDAVLRPLLGLLASVAQGPDPVALLEALLADVESQVGS